MPSFDKLDAMVQPNIPPPTTATFLGNNTDCTCSMILLTKSDCSLFS